jgi:hypothetical protein
MHPSSGSLPVGHSFQDDRTGVCGGGEIQLIRNVENSREIGKRVAAPGKTRTLQD